MPSWVLTGDSCEVFDFHHENLRCVWDVKLRHCSAEYLQHVILEIVGDQTLKLNPFMNIMFKNIMAQVQQKQPTYTKKSLFKNGNPSLRSTLFVLGSSLFFCLHIKAQLSLDLPVASGWNCGHWQKTAVVRWFHYWFMLQHKIGTYWHLVMLVAKGFLQQNLLELQSDHFPMKVSHLPGIQLCVR